MDLRIATAKWLVRYSSPISLFLGRPGRAQGCSAMSTTPYAAEVAIIGLLDVLFCDALAQFAVS